MPTPDQPNTNTDAKPPSRRAPRDLRRPNTPEARRPDTKPAPKPEPTTRKRKRRPRSTTAHPRLQDCTIKDRARLRARIRKLRDTKPDGTHHPAHASQRIEQEIQRAAEKHAARAASVPNVVYPESLPVSKARELLKAAIRDHQVTVICGETGSGKTTQLPKLCLELGRGVDGMIGHTQPRRLAARAVAARIAQELRVPLGGRSPVGYQVRFDDRTHDNTLVKLMTDGVLLTETQRDRKLLAYDTIIIDEAHERSLNIDFLLGYLAQLLPKRPDLKLIITSATINTARFAAHFARFANHDHARQHKDAADRHTIERLTAPTHNDTPDDAPVSSIQFFSTEEEPADAPADAWGTTGFVPVIAVSGRTYPVTVNHLAPDTEPEDEDDRDVTAGVLAALDDIAEQEDANTVHRDTRNGDILVFLAGEREIREIAKALRETSRPKHLRDLEVLPLYARLANEDQDKVFKASKRRKIILSTNIAETSITVPGITYVIDPGQARISRYAARSRVQRLPVEPVSQASANQRSGRCGRVAPGVCYRLYAEDDHNQRPPFTDPEILRTNLAGVILQMRALKLGSPNHFPFIDPPKHAMVREGEQTLHEIGALDDDGELTKLGTDIARIPADPRIARMILAGDAEGCIADILIIASALSIQDPRERPAAKRDAADRAHEQFAHEGSDFLSFLKLWDWFHKQREAVGSSKLKKLCIERFLNHVRLREWLETHRQLRDIANQSGLNVSKERTADPDAIHRALLTGLLNSIGFREGKFEYTGPGHTSFFLWPGSGQFHERPKWVMAAEVVETEKRYARTVAPVDPEWAVELGHHLVSRSHSDPKFHPRKGKVLANEKVSLHGLTLIPSRPVDYGPIDPRTARELFIYHGLVLEEWLTNAPFMEHNRNLIEHVEQLEAKKRKRDVLVEHYVRFAFYDERVPEDVYTGEAFERWLQKLRKDDKRILFMTEEDLTAGDTEGITQERFPDALPVGDSQMPLSYKLEPGTKDDGVTITVPVEALGQLDERRAQWLVPGMLTDKIVALIRTLPKDQRRALVPAPEIAQKVAASILTSATSTQQNDQENHSKPQTKAASAGVSGGGGGGMVGGVVDAVADAVKRITGTAIPRELWDPAKLPDHLRMNVRVTDDAGQVIAESRDIPALKRQLQHKMRASFESISDERWRRDNITDWDFGPLPQTTTIKRADANVTVYPALVDDTNAVKIRLFETRAAADAAHRNGLRRLFDLRAHEELRAHAAYLPGFDELATHFAAIGSADTLRASLRLILADRLFVGDRPEVRDQRAFDARLDAGWHRIGETTHAVCDLALQILRKHTAVRLLLDHPPNHVPEQTLHDARLQVDALITTGFLAATPVEWLAHYPRYLHAIELRFQRAAKDQGDKDAERARALYPHVRQYRGVLAQRPDARAASPEFDHLGWMIEEFRVSLFAQELRTAIPISDRRLRDQWPKCRL